jgi:aminoglycoside 6-adenylyltransferase
MVMIPIEAIEGVVSSEGALPVLARGYRLLVDKDGRFTSLAGRVAAADPNAIDAAAPWPPDPAAVANAVNDYLYHCAWITKKLRRGELAVAVACQNLHQARTMRRFVEWQAKARTGGATNTYYDGRHLERWAVPETVAGLGVTQSRYSPSDVRRAVLESADLFRTIAIEVGRACDVGYPEAAHERVLSWVREQLVGVR